MESKHDTVIPGNALPKIYIPQRNPSMTPLYPEMLLNQNLNSTTESKHDTVIPGNAFYPKTLIPQQNPSMTPLYPEMLFRYNVRTESKAQHR